MNTFLSAPRVALIALALGTAGVTATFAQTTNTPSTTAPAACTADGGWHHHHHRGDVLTPAEWTQLKNAKTQALASNGTLQTEETNLKTQFQTLKSEGSSATKDQWQALHQQKEAFHKDLKAAELLIDPSLAPIFAKLEAAHQGWRHHSSATPST